jgi:hypothetical protein
MEKRMSRFRLASLLVLVLVAAVPATASAQSAKDLAAKFSPIASYLAGPDIVVFADFDGAGQVCEAVVEKRVYQTPGSKGASLIMPTALVKGIVDQLAPVAERGKDLSPNFDAESVITGGSYHLKSDYENVSIETIGTTSSADGIQAVRIKWTKRTCASPAPSK